MGFDDQLAGLDLTDRKQTFSRSSDGVSFYEFIDVSAEHVVALFEIEVCCVDWTGRQLWQTSTNPIVDHERAGHALQVTCDDGSQTLIDLRTGNAARQ